MDSMADSPSMQRAKGDRSVLKRYLSATMDLFLFLEVKRTSITSRQVTRITTISRMSFNFDQIQPLTAVLSALECLKNQYFVIWPL